MKLKLILFFCVLTIVQSRLQEGIVGGKNAKRGAFPNMVLIYGAKTGREESQVLFCGGTMYNIIWIIISGDCAEGIDKAVPIENIKVVAGRWNIGKKEKSSQERTIKLFRIHKSHNSSLIGKSIDLGLLKLNRALISNTYVRVIPFSKNHAYPKGRAIIIGWGATVSYNVMRAEAVDILKIAQVDILPMNKCKDSIKELMTTKKQKFSESCFTKFHFCTKSPGQDIKAPAFGDAGGPILQLNKDAGLEVIGLISQGHQGLGVYMHISQFIGWIESVIASDPQS